MSTPYIGLPLEVFLNVLDQLVGIPDGRQPIFDASSPVTKTLRALAVTSRTIYLIASRYLYSHCLYLGDCISYSCLRRTLGLDLGNHPKALPSGQAGRNDGLCEDARMGSNWSGRNIFLQMPNLEELVASHNVVGYFPLPPPNLKRLAITTQDLHDTALSFCSIISTLRTLILLRPTFLTAADITHLFTAPRSPNLSVILVAVNSDHRTPKDTRTWTDDDKVTIWEADVPTSFYGDDDDLVLCEGWMWRHAVEGSLWTVECRRMASWAEVERRLAGPVHWVVDEA
ncbi:hypothetical protein N0V95_002265 [Ascochyta clinopodiicola]|nr:hypothetical protein N0V95_002265 [Ascochyta clinopodiicola]